MKNFLPLFFLLPGLTVKAQIRFENSSLQNIYAEAAKENKLIFLQLESANCDQCNEVANKAFAKFFPDSIRNHFVFLKLSADNKERVEIDRQYNTANTSCTLFLNAEGALVHKYGMTTTKVERYFEQCNFAIEKAKNKGNIEALKKMYDSGNREINFLEQYLSKRRELGMATDTLLDEYVARIPVDSARSLRVLRLIATMAPVINSAADSVLRNDQTLFSQAWYAIPSQQRSSINSQLIAKSKQKAINAKNFSALLRIASFARSTFSNKEQGEKQYLKIQVDYYMGTRDTLNYITNAISYYDKYFMTLTLDQIEKTDSLRRIAMLNKAPIDTVDLGEGIINYRRSISFSPQKQFYANELNRAAWTLYKMSNDQNVLKKALQWSARSIEFFESSSLMDTYAKLLYKTGSGDEALVWETKAIDFLKHRGFSAAEFERSLKRMKHKETIIDD